MILAVDEDIPYWQRAFSGLGEIRPFSGRKLRSAEIRDVDALVVRTATQVNESLLGGSSVRFVGSATIGMDHLDEAYLKSRAIYYTNAAGSNANAVAEYVTTALLVMANRRGWNLAQKSIAIIGVGHVGSRVEKKACALGMKVVLCDPPLRETTGDARYLFLNDVLWADILTFHVPLKTEGPYPTWHMLDRPVLERLSPKQFVINTARGSVFNGDSLKAVLEAGQIEGAVLDVWEGEPRIDYSLVDMADLASAHIAGYSLNGKIRATEMILQELCRFFAIPFCWDSRNLYPQPVIIRPAAGSSGQEALRSVVLQAYDILRDDADIRALESLGEAAAEAGFDHLRNDYALRPEFGHFIVDLAVEQQKLASILGAMGFQTFNPAPESGGG